MKVNRTTAWALVGTFLATSSFAVIAHACTLMGVSGGATEDGNAYIASTSDNPYIQGPRKPVYVTIPKNGYKFVHTPLHHSGSSRPFLRCRLRPRHERKGVLVDARLGGAQ